MGIKVGVNVSIDILEFIRHPCRIGRIAMHRALSRWYAGWQPPRRGQFPSLGKHTGVRGHWCCQDTEASSWKVEDLRNKPRDQHTSKELPLGKLRRPRLRHRSGIHARIPLYDPFVNFTATRLAYIAIRLGDEQGKLRRYVTATALDTGDGIVGFPQYSSVLS